MRSGAYLTAEPGLATAEGREVARDASAARSSRHGTQKVCAQGSWKKAYQEDDTNEEGEEEERDAWHGAVSQTIEWKT